MRESLLFLIPAVALFAQMGSPIPQSVASPRAQDLMNFDISLAITGRVLLEDRQPPPEPIPVEYSCRGATHAVVTDTKGHFAIPMGHQEATRTADVTDRSIVEGCRVQVRVPGFEELLVPVKAPNKIASMTVGDLTLKQISPQAGAVFSASGKSAPPKARSNYVKAFEDITQGKYPEALAALNKAITAYPQYASALQLKGNVLEFMSQRDAAREAYQQAAAADPSYATPLVQLAQMAAEDQNAADAAKWSAKVDQMVPGAYPDIYLIEGGSDLLLRHYDDAEKAARTGIDADPKFTCPGLRKLMADVLYRKSSYTAALDLYQWYLKEAPDANDIPTVQQRIEVCKRLVKVTQN